ncbi:MAG: acyltransferase domain-containing protein [Kofleriaceae bacterium]
MTRKRVLLFSGQGAQYYQMGRGLYEGDPTFRATMQRLDAQVVDTLGVSVLAELYGARGRAEPFEDLRLTHPAIFMVEYALAQVYREQGAAADYALGASLGTLAALAVAGALAVTDALALVLAQARIIVDACPPGGMIGVLADPRLYRESPELRARAVLAGQNFATHFVLSSPQAHLEHVEASLRAADVTHQRLPVRYPFHSPWMEPIRAQLIAAFDDAAPRPGALPVICCALGAALDAPSAQHLWRVARDPIDFMHTIDRLELEGPFDYVDLSPSGTLATFLKYHLGPGAASRVVAVMSPFGGETTASVAAALDRLERAPR